jgi:hypothetical protein
MSDQSNLKRDLYVNNRKFILIRDVRTSFWSIQSQNGHLFDGQYTNIEQAKSAAMKLSEERPPIKYKQVKGS